MSRVFMTSGSGYIGSAVAAQYLQAGHDVTAVARSEESAQFLQGIGVKVQPGNLRHPREFISQIEAADIIVHTAASSDAGFSGLDLSVSELILELCQYTGKTFIYTSGTWIFGNTNDEPAEEHAPADPLPMVAFRVALEQRILHAASRDLRTVIIRPTVAYGRSQALGDAAGDGGLMAQMIASAWKNGVVSYIGSGKNLVPLVNINDLSRLYLMATDSAPAGAIYHATNDEVLSLAQIADLVASACGVDGHTRSIDVSDARKLHGPFVDGYVLSQRIGSTKAQSELGWQPQYPSLQEFLHNSIAVPSMAYQNTARVA